MISFTVNFDDLIASMRLDLYLAQECPELSRSFIKKLILENKVSCNDKVANKPSLLVYQNDTITIQSLELAPRVVNCSSYADFFKENLIFEHEHFLVINKPVGLITHPSSEQNDTVTLSDIVLYHYPQLANVGESKRPGIVHRLDGNTSGIILVAKTQHGYTTLTSHFKNRTIQKIYHAVVKGHPAQEGSFTDPIGRHQLDPRKMTCRTAHGLEAHTDYTVLTYFDDATLLEVRPKTGRTHQIRVHCSYNGYPLLGDEIYGIPSSLIKRQALHAYQISFDFDGTAYSFICPQPGDFKRVILALSVQ